MSDVAPPAQLAPEGAAPAESGGRERAARTEPGQPIAAPSYEVASARIEEIIRRLDSGQAGLRETLELCQEGRRLIELCAAELEALGQGLEELRLDELVARLDTGRVA